MKTASGIPGVGQVPWGSHFCHWYFARADLVACLVPYFEAGLRNNERCLWVTAEPYDAAAGKRDLEAIFPDVGPMIENGRLRILDASEWYMNGNSVRGQDVIEHWLEEERAALADGYTGLRISGNTSFVGPDGWQAFIDYEKAFDQAMSGARRILALCSYNLLHVQPAEMFEAVRSHQFTIHPSGDEWQALDG